VKTLELSFLRLYKSTSMISKDLDAELNKDFEHLRIVHGLNDVLFESLLASKAEALAHIRFFKRMVFISNCVLMTLGLCFMRWGFKNGVSNVSLFQLIIGSLGFIVFLWFCRVFVRGVRSVQAVEDVARRHNLI